MALCPDFTLGLASPAFSDVMTGGAGAFTGTSVDSSQYGFFIGGTTRKYSKDQCWIVDPTRTRTGQGIKITHRGDSGGTPNAHTASQQVIGDHRTVSAPLTEGDEEWLSWSWWFPSNWPGTNSWMILFEIASGTAGTHPRNGTGFESVNPAQLTLRFKNGLVGDPGSGSYDGSYNALETMLGTGAPRPFTKGVWHDFYQHTIYRARAPYTSANSVYELWHREEGGVFEKLYSNKNDGTALINRAPHPTWYYNNANGAPGEGGTVSAHYLTYRSYHDTSQPTLVDEYWMSPFRCRASQQAILNMFASYDNPTAPTITSFTPTSGTAGVTSVTVNGTNFVVINTQCSFNGVLASISGVTTTQFTATVPATATTGKIQVTTPNGTATSATDFTVGATSGPTLPDPAAGHLRIGNATLDPSTTAIGNNFKRVLKRGVGAGNTVTIDKGYAFLVGPTSGGAQLHRLVVYDDDGSSGLPGSYKGTSDEVSVALNASGAWVEFPFTTPALVTGDQIYFGLWEGGSGTGFVGYTTLAGAGWVNANTYVTGQPPSNPFGTSTVINLEVSLVVDYTTASDTLAPLLSVADASVSTLLLTYNEPLDSSSVPTVADYTVTVNQSSSWPLTSVAVSGATVAILLDNPIVSGDILTVSYTVPGTGFVRDVAGNPASNLGAFPVTNSTQQAPGSRRVDPAHRVAVARRVDPTDRRAGAGGGL